MVENVISLQVWILFGTVIATQYAVSGSMSLQISEISQSSLFRIRIKMNDYFNISALTLILGSILVNNLWGIIFPWDISSAIGLYMFRGLLFLLVVYLIPVLVYIFCLQHSFFITFYQDHIEIRDRRDVALLRWGVPALAIPYTALGGFHVKRHALYVYLDGIPRKIFIKWPIWSQSAYWRALDRVLNAVAVNFGAHIINPLPESELPPFIASDRSIFSQFRFGHHFNPIKWQQKVSHVPSELSGKLLHPGEIIRYFLRPDSEKVKGKKGSDRILALTTNKIVNIFNKDHYRISFYDQVDKIEVNPSSLIIRFKYPTFKIDFGDLPDDCPLEEIKKFIDQQKSLM